MTTEATSKTPPLMEKPAWKALGEHYQNMRNVNLRSLFADDPHRGERLTVEGAGLYLDYSKNRITDETIRLLFNLAEECGLREHIEAMFRGKKINATENRAVLHIALRAPKGEQILVDGVDVVPGVYAVLDRMAAFSDQVRSGQSQAQLRDLGADHGLGQHPQAEGQRGRADRPPLQFQGQRHRGHVLVAELAVTRTTAHRRQKAERFAVAQHPGGRAEPLGGLRDPHKPNLTFFCQEPRLGAEPGPDVPYGRES